VTIQYRPSCWSFHALVEHGVDGWNVLQKSLQLDLIVWFCMALWFYMVLYGFIWFYLVLSMFDLEIFTKAT
jgi:hypothetical protein